ncbi:hypothetical protein HELRODRAFT_161212 [Helobdella robusta]|uniref:Uncharacterized protein n=1 Tax=Helobdella robusta TaxID=6412 RepID=T1ER78_HELRO|nr:hypothetical protein HELRODRAFT_161212 [Helobdella robusta]ESO01994.1 hypothetical protein HELRODRAFT_161212 [Helobdella robusta]
MKILKKTTPQNLFKKYASAADRTNQEVMLINALYANLTDFSRLVDMVISIECNEVQIGSKAGQEPAIQYMDLYWIVFIVVLSVITISTLLTAVVIFKQRNNKKKQSQRFKSRMEALKALTTKEITNSNSGNNNSFSSSNILAESVPLNANNLSKRSSECKFERQSMKMMDVDRDTKANVFVAEQTRVSSKIPQCPDRPYVFIKNISPSSCFEFKTATFTTKLDALPEDNQNFNRINILNATKGITTSHYSNNTMPLSSSISSTNLCKNNNNDPQFNSLTFDQNGSDGNNYCCCPLDVELCNNEMSAIAMKNIYSKSLTRKLNKSTKQYSTQQFNCNNSYVNTLSSDANSIIEDPKIVVSKVRNVVASNKNSNNDAPNNIVRAGRSEDQCTLMTRHHPHQQTHSQQNSLSDNDSCLSDTVCRIIFCRDASFL